MVLKDPRVRTCTGEDAELLIPPHPELRIYPAWLRERALEREPNYKGSWPNSDADAVSYLIETLKAGDWLDHWGTAIYGGKEFLISEPYHMNRERVDQLLRFCDALGLAFNIQSSGHHYPTLTMRIFVWPKEWSVGDHFCQEEEGYNKRAEPAKNEEASSKPTCLAQRQWRLDGIDIEIAICRLLESNQMFAFLPRGETSFDNVTFVAVDHRESFMLENPNWCDVSDAYVRKLRQ